MDTNQIEQPAALPNNELILSEEAKYYLQKGGQWARFLGIMGFIACGFLALISVFIGRVYPVVNAMTHPYSAQGIQQFMGRFLTVIYLLMAVIYFFPSRYLYQFGDHVKKGFILNDSQFLTSALGKLKSTFKFWGILTIVLISLYILVIIVAIIAAATIMHR